MEIEIKARCEDFAGVASRLKSLGAKQTKEKHQIDAYYNHPTKDLRKLNEYIRLRKNPGAKGAVFAYHVNLADGVNDETETAVDDAARFEKILGLCGFTQLGVIDKTREEYALGAFKVTLDRVKGIGDFVEIETEGTEAEQKAKKQACLGLLKKLGIPEKSLTNVWLCDIATGKAKLDG